LDVARRPPAKSPELRAALSLSRLWQHQGKRAEALGARVIATAGSDWKLQKAKELGADEVINHTATSKFSQRIKELTDGRGVDVVFDCVGAAVWDENLNSLTPGGRLVITGVTSGN
jgi:NADPH:quinone reductase-like Zn-dependent oxidoreductase